MLHPIMVCPRLPETDLRRGRWWVRQSGFGCRRGQSCALAVFVCSCTSRCGLGAPRLLGGPFKSRTVAQPTRHQVQRQATSFCFGFTVDPLHVGVTQHRPTCISFCECVGLWMHLMTTPWCLKPKQITNHWWFGCGGYPPSGKWDGTLYILLFEDEESPVKTIINVSETMAPVYAKADWKQLRCLHTVLESTEIVFGVVGLPFSQYFNRSSVRPCVSPFVSVPSERRWIMQHTFLHKFAI